MEVVVSVLIPAIVESVFGALTEAVGLSDWLRQRLGRDPEKLAFQQALTQALTDCVTHYPGRDLRYFAEILADRNIGGPLLARTLQPAAPLPTADELTTVWLNHLTVDSLIHYRTEFSHFATLFLDRLQFHLENQQPLQWIAQARRQRSSEEAIGRMADAAEQSAINVEAMRQEIARLTSTLVTVLQASSGSTVTTGGGAYIGGNVSAYHFAGRDLTINQYFVDGPTQQYIDSISRSFRQATEKSNRYTPHGADPFVIFSAIGKIDRSELITIEELLGRGHNVVLLGEAGTGKSGIAHQLAIAAEKQRKGVLLLDMRNYAHIHSDGELRYELNLSDSVQNAIVRFAQYSDDSKAKGLRLIIEQFDNVANSHAGKVLVDLAIACADIDGVEVVVVTRQHGKASNYVDKLINKQFECVICESLSDDRTYELLSKININEPSSELVALASNLLQLSLISQIKAYSPAFDFSEPFTQVELWQEFVKVLKEAENYEQSASQLLDDIVDLARTSLNAIDGTFTVEHNNPYDRLVSWQIVVPTQWPRKYRFRHQQLQTFFYASDAFDRGLTPNEIVGEIDRYNSHDIFAWVEKLFAANQYTTIPANYYRQIFDPTCQTIPFYSQSRVLEFYTQSEKLETHDQAFKIILRDLTRQKQEDGLRLQFFKLQPSAAWAPHLLKEGILTTPPSTDYQQCYQSWDAQWYLWSVAEQVPDVVRKHIEAADPNEWHPAHIARTIKILQRISPEQASMFAPKICGWLSISTLAAYIAEDVYELIVYFAQNGSKESSFELFRLLIKPILYNQVAVPTFGQQHDDVLGKGADALITLDSVQLFEILEVQLTQALQMEFEARTVDHPQQTALWSWRPAIGDDGYEVTDRDYAPYRRGRTYKDNLLRLLRDVLKYRTRLALVEVQPLLEKYLSVSESRNIFRCLALYILHQFPSQFARLVKQELLDLHRVYEFSVPHDYFLLISAGYQLLLPAEQHQLLECICNGPVVDDNMRAWAEFAINEWGEDPKEYVQKRCEKEILERLHLLRENLDDEHRKFYEVLLGRYGLPTYKDEPRVHPITSEWDDESKRRQLAELSPEELVAFATQWKPERDFWVGDAYEMFGHQIARIVCVDIARYVSVLPQLAQVHFEIAKAMYEHYLPNGNHVAEIPWEVCINLSEFLLADDSIRTTLDSDPFGKGWGSVRYDIVRLISVGIHNQAHPAPAEYYGRFLNLLLHLKDDPDDKSVQSFTIATLIGFARKTASNGDTKGHGPDRFAPIIKEALTKKLTAKNYSLAVHAVFGENLYILHWLHFNWLTEHIDIIFPEQKDDIGKDHFMAAWSAYITHHCHWECREILQLLYPKYQHAIELYSKMSDFDVFNAPVSALASHVTIEYLLNNYELHPTQGRSCLMMAFCDAFPQKHIGSISHTMWLWCHKPEQASRDWSKIQRYWKWRNEISIANDHPVEMDMEMRWFAGCLEFAPTFVQVSSIQSLLEGLLPHLTRLDSSTNVWEDVRHFLVREVEYDSEIVVDFFHKIHQQANLSEWFYKHDETHNLLKIGASSSSKTRETVLSIIDSLKRRGYNIMALNDFYL